MHWSCIVNTVVSMLKLLRAAILDVLIGMHMFLCCSDRYRMSAHVHPVLLRSMVAEYASKSSVPCAPMPFAFTRSVHARPFAINKIILSLVFIENCVRGTDFRKRRFRCFLRYVEHFSAGDLLPLTISPPSIVISIRIHKLPLVCYSAHNWLR